MEFKGFEKWLEDQDESNSAAIERRLDTKRGLQEEYKAVYEEIVEALGEVTAECEENFEAFEEIYFNCMAKADDLLAPRNSALNVNTSRNESVVEAKIKLPTLDLPEFTGELTDWAEFVDCFESMVNNNSALSEVNKLQYLKASLKGEAAKVLSEIKICSGNLAIAWQLLKDRYEVTELIANSHIRAIMDLPVITRENVGQLRVITDTLTKSIRGLEGLGVQVNTWDTILIFIVCEKLDGDSRRGWEQEKEPPRMPSLSKFLQFLQKRCKLLELLRPRNETDNKGQGSSRGGGYVAQESPKCVVCSGDHTLLGCRHFKGMTLMQKRRAAVENKIGFGCLKRGHSVQVCRAARCVKCQARHHVLIHPDDGQGNAANTQANANSRSGGEQRSDSRPAREITTVARMQNNAVLSTAVVFVKDKRGGWQRCRVLLDSGSTVNIMSEECCTRLGLLRKCTNISLSGVSAAAHEITYSTRVSIRSADGNFEIENADCLILNKITDMIPLHSFNIRGLSLPNYIRLADKGFNISANIDILCGSEVFWKVLGNRSIELKAGLCLRQTAFGWIVVGSPETALSRRASMYRENCNVAVLNSLTKFWEIEELPGDEREVKLSEEELACEESFVKNTARSSEGRFICTYPKSDDINKLGNSFVSAERRLRSMEKRFRNDTVFKEQYSKFMSEYLELGDMRYVGEVSRVNQEGMVLLPHHGVIKSDSATTRCRVVFDASCPISTGWALNDGLLAGPVILDSLFAIILRFLLHTYVITADIARMYRQVLISEEDRKLQRILWRENQSENLNIFELLTLSYGLKPSSFLATRCLKQLAVEIEATEPEIARSIQHAFYMDDWLEGGENLEELKLKAFRIAEVLRGGGFELRKWRANNAELLKEFGEVGIDRDTQMIKDEGVKALGLMWGFKEDEILFKINLSHKRGLTKRELLSEVSRIFDPLGLIAPCVILAKIMIQKLWKEKIGWDDKLPVKLQTQWEEFTRNLSAVSEIRIPRSSVIANRVAIELVGFSDASMEAYGGVVYVKSRDELGSVSVRILCAKTRVAPLKEITIPRLELLGEVVLIKLTENVLNTVSVKVDSVTLFSDSTIVLAWLKVPSSKLKQFVANRMALVQEISGNLSAKWKYVASDSNPADLLSRGVVPEKLGKMKLWWEGPEWLKEKVEFQLSKVNDEEKVVPELKEREVTLVAIVGEFKLPLNYSNLSANVRVYAYCLRWLGKRKGCKMETGPMTVEERKNARNRLIKYEQGLHFKRELKDIKRGKGIHKGSPIFPLNPSLVEGLLRVGGRLENACALPFEERHQIILATNGKITKLIAEREHKALLHCGPQSLLASLRRKYWPVKGRNLVRELVKGCVICFKARPKCFTPVTGMLPKERVTPELPFAKVGCDFAGPVLLRDRAGRGFKRIKAYICLFVCLVTKAVHLELVMDLMTEAFIATLRRFVARRGANNELADLEEFLRVSQDKVKGIVAEEGIVFKFIVPRSPNFGGLWERRVRSVKEHLRRVSGMALLTYDEYYTLLTQIESILNSRPLSPLSSNPEDLNPLTPAHFLIGRAMTTVPEESLLEINENRLSRFQRVQQLVQHYWQRWHKEYLSELQAGVRGDKNCPAIKVGTLVLVRESNLPVCKWSLARVIELCPGTDNVTRVVKIKTANSVLKRAVRNLCVLPVD